MRWTELDRDVVHMWALVSKVINLELPQKTGKLFTSWMTIVFLRRTFLHGVRKMRSWHLWHWLKVCLQQQQFIRVCSIFRVFTVDYFNNRLVCAVNEYQDRQISDSQLVDLWTTNWLDCTLYSRWVFAHTTYRIWKYSLFVVHAWLRKDGSEVHWLFMVWNSST